MNELPGDDLSKKQKEMDLRANKFAQFQLDDWRKMLMDPAGRTVVGQLLLFCRTLEANTEATGEAMAWREGLRAAGLYVMDHVRKAAPGQYLEILREAEALADFFQTAKPSELARAREYLAAR